MASNLEPRAIQAASLILQRSIKQTQLGFDALDLVSTRARRRLVDFPETEELPLADVLGSVRWWSFRKKMIAVKFERGLELVRRYWVAAVMSLLEACKITDMPYASLVTLFRITTGDFVWQMQDDVYVLTNAQEALSAWLGLAPESDHEKTTDARIRGMKQSIGDRNRQYELDAFRSFVEAVQRNPDLANTSLDEVYQWMSANGVQLNGAPYEPPSCATWKRYQRAGKSRAKNL